MSQPHSPRMRNKMKIAILGFGREGQAALKFLNHAKAYAGAELWILDQNMSAKIPQGTKSILGPRHMESLDSFDVIIRSPGVPYMHSALVRARRKGVTCSSATELFFEHLMSNVNGQWSNVAVVGITGTKGKGTTSTLLYKILKAAKKDVYLAGNIGTPALEILPKLKKKTLVILELSSFQLQGLRHSPHIAVVLGIFPDHQENIRTAKHGTHLSFAEYVSSKSNIARSQKKGDVVFYADNKISRSAANKSKGKKIALRASSVQFLKPGDVRMPGMHNFLNAVTAAQVARSLKISPSIILRAIRTFKGNEHRLELVRTIHGVSLFNDSASTNPYTSAAAVRAFSDTPHILIAGGHDKGLDYAPLAKALRESKTKLVVLYGENKQKITKAIRIRNYELGIIVVKDLEQAVKAAYRAACSSMVNGQWSMVILFSPGAASFDMFKNYADRGEQFKRIVKGLVPHS